MQDIVCFSHLRWDFVWQRPQHLLSRLSKNARVFFVEEPVTNLDSYGEHLHHFEGRGADNVRVVRLVQPAKDHRWLGHGDPATQKVYESLLRGFLKQEGVTNPLLWFYTPMALPFASSLPHTGVVYDVMDELSTFKNAPEGLLKRADTLLKRADLVFAGGPSLWRSRVGKNPNLHLFPSGVDEAHFKQAVQKDVKRPEDLADVDGPVLGYFGVIDERMDLGLLEHLAKQRPDWHVVMLGPVVKIEATSLPQAPNLHYLGMKAYEDLPGYLAHFDVALIPFALNEATEFLSPTKTLEYLAAGKPVVSTPLPDVVGLYGEVVRVGATPAAFLRAVEAALAKDRAAKTQRHERAQTLLTRYSWDAIAAAMARELEQLAERVVERVA